MVSKGLGVQIIIPRHWLRCCVVSWRYGNSELISGLIHDLTFWQESELCIDTLGHSNLFTCLTCSGGRK